MINLVYSNGCSHSAGGGLESIRKCDNYINILVKEAYNFKFGINWEKQEETTYCAQLAKIINADFCVEATSGGGSNRVVRMTYDFVKKHYDKKDEILLLLEFPSFFQRLELYSVELKNFLIINQMYNENGERVEMNATQKYFGEIGFNEMEIINKNNALKLYLDKFVDLDIENQRAIREIELLLTFLNYHNIKHIWWEAGKLTQKTLPKNFIKNELNFQYENEIQNDFHSFCCTNKLTIKDELEGLTHDMHPGYFGHLKFAEILYDDIKQRGWI